MRSSSHAEASRRAAPGFDPRRHGFRFANRFTLPLLTRAPLLSDVLQKRGLATYGLCGGMVALAADAYQHGSALPAREAPPAFGTPLWRALMQRQIDTLGGWPLLPRIATFARWTALPDGPLQRGTAAAWPGIHRRLAAGRLVQLGLVYARRLSRLWENHQVLAYGVETTSGGTARVLIYDPNYPLRNDVALHLMPRLGGRLAARQYAGRRPVRRVRGCFALPLRLKPPAW